MNGSFCCLCGNTSEADLGQVIGICLDADACHQRQREAGQKAYEDRRRAAFAQRVQRRPMAGYGGYRLPPGRRGSTT
jgi:hypothetical protein